MNNPTHRGIRGSLKVLESSLMRHALPVVLSLKSALFAISAAFIFETFPAAHAALPALPPGDNTENIVFQDDFSNGNLKGWSNIATGSGKAFIGSDPGGSGADVWYPGNNSDGVAVSSALTLPLDMDLADGTLAIYMRVRVDGGNSIPDGNCFSVTLTEKAPGTRLGALKIRPGSNSVITYRNSSGTGVSSNGLTYSFPSGSSTFQDFRLEFSMTDASTPPGNYLNLKSSYYNSATGTYVSLGNVNGAHISSGIFNQFSIYSRNSGGRAYFDSVVVTQKGSPRASYPSNAYRLPLPLPANVTIQSALDTYNTVVLSKGDYSAGTAFILRSGQRLYGDQGGSTIPQVTIEAGAVNAVLSSVTVAGTGLTFPTSTTAVTRNCVFERLAAKITVSGGILVDNLFLYHDGVININTVTSGYLRNNRFIRTRTHASSNQLVMLGDSERKSYGNVFLWKNFLTPGGDATNISNQEDLTFVGADAESWNWNGTGSGAALWKVGRMGTLRIFGMNGGNHGNYKTGDFDVDADEFQLFNDTMETIGAPLVDYALGANNLRALLVGSNSTGKIWTNLAISPFRLKGFDSATTDVSTSTSSTFNPSWTIYTSPLPADQQTILRSMIVNPLRPAGQVLWESPKHSPIPDPAGPNWATDLAGKPDSTAYIQGLIDTNGIARLSSGIYYISQPLKLSLNEGIIGAGADTTAIIAKINTMDMIVADDPSTAPGSGKIVLSDITLQGGGNGIHLEPVGTSTSVGRIANYVGCYINHVTFRNMGNAGIFMEQIRSLDNNFFAYVHFANCDTGLKQRTGTLAQNLMFMDKCIFYKSQFVGNRLALDLPGNRACCLDAWVNCLFQDNSGGVAAMNNYLSALFANCDFINNGGSAVFSNNYAVNHVSNSYVAGAAGVAMFAGPLIAEGCSFERESSNTANILSGSNSRVYLNNCSTPDMPLALPANANGILINTYLGMDSSLNQQMISIKNGTVFTLLPGIPYPQAQLLLGSDWSSLDAPVNGY